MEGKKELARLRLRKIAEQTPPDSDLRGYFEAVYSTANGEAENVPWADLQPHPLALEWLQQHKSAGQGGRALVVGCGLGDDAEELARRGWNVTAFDISSKAIAWCKERFPASSVDYQNANLFETPASWRQAFDFILEIYTIQATPLKMHATAIASVASLLAPGGQLLVICRAREPHEAGGPLRWPLTRAELASFEQAGLRETSFEDIENADGRHFRLLCQR
ncbi:MAG TPA: class I SAM-dependent methyltransferase [Ktedonobacteraceae bacterium]|nr:class I SAM-dependent methyltransferase [Ktedonobacteraceae bacterium]